MLAPADLATSWTRAGRHTYLAEDGREGVLPHEGGRFLYTGGVYRHVYEVKAGRQPLEGAVGGDELVAGAVRERVHEVRLDGDGHRLEVTGAVVELRCGRPGRRPSVALAIRTAALAMRYGSSQNSNGWACLRHRRQYGQVPAGGLGRRLDLRLVTVADVYDERRSLDGSPTRGA